MGHAVMRSGDVEIDALCRTVKNGAHLRQPPPKVLEFLVYLVQHRDRVVSKVEVLREIWPGVQVSEASLRWLLKEARRCIGDNGFEQRYVETKRGFGWLWAADVSLVQCSKAAVSDPVCRVARGAVSGSTPLFAASHIAQAADPERCRMFIAMAQARLRAGEYTEARDALLRAAELAMPDQLPTAKPAAERFDSETGY